jgi:hypothetical protein
MGISNNFKNIDVPPLAVWFTIGLGIIGIIVLIMLSVAKDERSD